MAKPLSQKYNQVTWIRIDIAAYLVFPPKNFTAITLSRLLDFKTFHINMFVFFMFSVTFAGLGLVGGSVWNANDWRESWPRPDVHL